MPLYLIPAEFSQFPDIAALSKAVADRGYDLSKHFVVKGVALRPVNRLELQPLDAVPKAKRDKDAEKDLAEQVMRLVREHDGTIKIEAVVKALKIDSKEVSRIKAALVKDKLLDAQSKKGTLAAAKASAQ